MEIKTFSDYIKESLEEVSMEETNPDIPYKELFNAVRNYGKTKPTDNKTSLNWRLKKDNMYYVLSINSNGNIYVIVPKMESSYFENKIKTFFGMDSIEYVKDVAAETEFAINYDKEDFGAKTIQGVQGMVDILEDTIEFGTN
jgi:hypothetical protein